MEINDYVYDLENGIGIIKNKIDGNFIVKFIDMELTLNSFDLILISNNVIDFILYKFEDEFSLNTLEKGLDYFKSNRVDSVTIMGSTISGTVIGNLEYKSLISINKKSNIYSCSCPVSSLCKHNAAILYKLRDDILKLNDNIIPKKEEKIEIISYNNLPININNYTDYLKYEAIYNKIKSLNSDDINLLVSQLIKNNNELSKNILFIIYNLDVDKSIINKIPSNTLALFRNYIYYISDIFNKINPNYYTYAYLYFMINNKPYFNYLLSFILKHDLYRFIKFNYIDLIALYNDIKLYDLNYKNIEIIFNSLDNDIKKIFIEKIEYPFLSDISFYQLDIVNRLYALDKVYNIKLIVKNIISEFKNYEAVDSLYFYNFLYRNISYFNIKERNTILDYLNENRENKYIIYLIEAKIKSDITISKFDFNPYFFNKYFIVKYNIDSKDFKFINFEVLFLNDKILHFNVLINNEEIKAFGNFNNCNLILAKNIYDYYKSDIDFKNYYNLKLNEFNNQKLNEIKNDFINDIKKLNRSNNIIKLNSKVNIEYYFNIGDKNTLELKVGINKYYIVKDFIEFLRNVENKKNYSYGKGLEFNHDISNFNELDIKVLEYFIKLPFDSFRYYYDKRNIILKDKVFNELLHLLINRNIYINDKSYLCSLTLFNINFNINKDYIFNVNIPSNSKLLDLGELILINNDNDQIELIDNTNKDLVLFSNKYNNINIKELKDLFIDNLYSNYNELINIDESIKNDFMLHELEINSYFDYDNKIITLKVELIKDDIIIIDKEQLSLRDKNHLLKYLEYINELGFINHEILNDEAKILEFFYLDFSYLKKLSNVYLSDSIKKLQVLRFNPPTVKVRYESTLGLVFESESQFSNSELEEIIKGIRRRKKYVLLNDDTIIDLSNNQNNTYNDIVTNLDLDIKNLLESKRINYINSIKLSYFNYDIDLDEFIINLLNDIKNYKNIDIDIPYIKGELRPYQIEGYKWLKVLSKYHLGGILADDMGLGKTIEMISLIESDHKNLPTLIISPKSLMFNWYNEINKFIPWQKSKMIYGNSSKRHKIINDIKDNEKIIYITSYDSLRGDLELYSNIEFNYLILDEAQAIKNVNAIKSKNVKSLKAINKFSLTGTPIENSVLDLWSIFDFILPQYLDNMNLFLSKYLNDESYTKIIANKIAPFILRRTKKEVLKDLPPKFEYIESCDMSVSQRKIYDSFIHDAKLKIEESESFEMLKYLTTLREICVDPKLIDLNYNDISGKLLYLSKKIPELINNNHRILLFSSFVKGLERVSELLNELNIKYLVLTGDTKLDKRKEETEIFNKDTSYKVYLISLKAGGVGLNLVGADTVIHLDPWWNLSQENQASDRAHRIGQVNNVNVIKLICDDSIEERVIELQNIKKGIIDKLISEDDTRISTITKDDIKFILS